MNIIDVVDNDKLSILYTIIFKCPDCGEWLKLEKFATSESNHQCPICGTWFSVNILVRGHAHA